MLVTSKTCEKYSYYSWYKTHSYYRESDTQLSKTLIERLLKYAMTRLDQDVLTMIQNNNWSCEIERLCDSDSETLNDSTYQVNFKNIRGLKISVDGILIKKYKPFLDHGISLDENQ